MITERGSTVGTCAPERDYDGVEPLVVTMVVSSDPSRCESGPRSPNKKMPLNESELSDLHHMLGYGLHIRPDDWGYRNYYAACKHDFPRMRLLVEKGLAFQGRTSGNITYFHATLSGARLAGLPHEAIDRAFNHDPS